jgi:type IV fimbrial biogenesis protein FimT
MADRLTMESGKKSSGFTLLELMVTLFVVAILVVWAAPNFRRLMDQTALTSETNSWVGVLNYARSEAITRGQKVTVCRRVNPGSCDGSANCDCGVTQSGSSSPPNYHTGYMIFTSTGNSQPLNFRPGSGNVLLRTGQAHSDKITIQGNGQANNAFSFMPTGVLADEDASGFSARHILCVTEAGNDSSASSTEQIPGRVVVISDTGRPRVMEFDVGADCYDPNSSNTAADLAKYQ